MTLTCNPALSFRAEVLPVRLWCVTCPSLLGEFYRSPETLPLLFADIVLRFLTFSAADTRLCGVRHPVIAQTLQPSQYLSALQKVLTSYKPFSELSFNLSHYD